MPLGAHDGRRVIPMSTHDNAPALEGWQVYAKCCGVLHELADVDCGVCLELLRPLDMPPVWDGDNA